MREIARRLERAGFSTFAVGGAVRDAVLGLPAQDWDLATRARPAEVRRLFRRTAPIGIEHGTVGVMGRDGILYEVTTFRRDVETFGRHAVVEFADTIEDDLARRDFTINALAWDPATEELRDPYGGLDDLARGILRTVGRAEERFAEDYLRVLRALRFAGHFRLTIEPETWRALADASPQLTTLSAERIREELLKILSKTSCASAALSLYAASGALRVLYPELQALVGLEDAHGDDVWARALRAVDALPPGRALLRSAALLHAVGVPAVRTRGPDGRWRCGGHERGGATTAEEILRRLRFSNAEIGRCGRLVRHQADLFPPDARPPIVRRWLRALGPDLLNDLWRLRFALWRARMAPLSAAPAEAPEGAAPPEGARPRAGAAMRLGTGEGVAGGSAAEPRPGGAAPSELLEPWRMARAVRRQGAPLSVGELAINGADLKALGVPPGRKFGELLRRLLERVIDDPALNTRERLLELAREELAREQVGPGDLTREDKAREHLGREEPDTDP